MSFNSKVTSYSLLRYLIIVCLCVCSACSVYGTIMLMAACHTAEANQLCSLDLRVYEDVFEDGFVHSGLFYALNFFSSLSIIDISMLVCSLLGVE